MTEIKPIAIIYFPDQFYEGQHRNWIYEYAASLNGDNMEGRFKLSTDYTQYLWFCFYKSDIDNPDLIVHHPKDFTPIQFKELKDMVMEEIKKLKQ
jgi:hypothetical protein